MSTVSFYHFSKTVISRSEAGLKVLLCGGVPVSLVVSLFQVRRQMKLKARSEKNTETRIDKAQHQHTAHQIHTENNHSIKHFLSEPSGLRSVT